MLEEWIRNRSSEEGGTGFDWRRKGRYVVVILVCLGLLALIWPAGTETNRENVPAPGNVLVNNPDSVKEQMSAELESILSQIEGAGKVDVSLSLSSEGTKSYATNLREEKREIKEEDSRGTTRTSVDQSISRDLAVSTGDPLLIEERRPEVLGALIVADGADVPEIKEKLTNATATLLDIPLHKVRVMSREGDV